MNPRAKLLLRVLLDPSVLLSLGGRPLSAILASARHAKVLSKLAQRAFEAGLEPRLEPRVRDHLLAARVMADHYRRVVRWETARIQEVLAPLDQPLVFLKGAAYVLADLPAGRGRLVSDIDAMIPLAPLADAEKRLLGAGWRTTTLDPYDQRYYRQWMHELPPLEHEARKVVLDLHHTILPRSGRLRPSASKLFEASRVVPGTAFRVLSPVDMVLHSAAHLFQDGDLRGGLRDLLDLDDLLVFFGRTEPDFWTALAPRAAEMDLRRPLYYALRFLTRLLATPVPPAVIAELGKAGKPAWPAAPLMDLLADRALLPLDERYGSAAAQWLLYVRSHWLRMPPLLLARHLARKAWRRFSTPEEIEPLEKRDTAAAGA